MSPRSARSGVQSLASKPLRLPRPAGPFRPRRSAAMRQARRPQPGSHSAGRPIDHIGEQERAALILSQPAAELPAHQRVQFSIFVNRLLDAHEQTLRVEPRQMFLEIERRPRRHGFARTRFGRFVEHVPNPVDRSQATICVAREQCQRNSSMRRVACATRDDQTRSRISICGRSPRALPLIGGRGSLASPGSTMNV